MASAESSSGKGDIRKSGIMIAHCAIRTDRIGPLRCAEIIPVKEFSKKSVSCRRSIISGILCIRDFQHLAGEPLVIRGSLTIVFQQEQFVFREIDGVAALDHQSG